MFALAARGRSLTIALLVVGALGCLNAEIEDDSVDVYRRAIVSLSLGMIEMPPGLTRSALSEATVADSELLAVLEGNDAESVAIAFPDFDAADTLGISLSGDTVRTADLRSIFEICFPVGTNVEEVCSLLCALAGVSYAESDGMVEEFAVPNDELFAQQWNLKNENNVGINATGAWDITQGSSGTVIGILDDGVDRTHLDLAEKIYGGDPTWNDDKGHGTHVAGIAAAATDNGIGIAGIDWSGRIYPKRVIRRGFLTMAKKIRQAIDTARVLNCSWGHYNFKHVLRSAFHDVYLRDLTTVAAMGNRLFSDDGKLGYPAAFGAAPESGADKTGVVIAVGAVDDQDKRVTKTRGFSWWSNKGDHIDLVAPGAKSPDTGIISTFPDPDNSYAEKQGTSMAAPHVTGVVGLVLSLRPDLSNDDIRGALRASAYHVGEMELAEWTPYDGDGRLDARMALAMLQEPYVFSQRKDEGGSVSSSSAWFQMDFPLRKKDSEQTGWQVRKHEVRTTVSWPRYAWYRVWGRKETRGYSAGEQPKPYKDPAPPLSQYEEGWCGILSSTESGAELVT